MSRDWTKEELHTASEVIRQNGYMGFEEFCHALEQKQPVRFGFQERNRKELANDISEILEEKAQYMKMPTCAYQIGSYIIAKDGTRTVPMRSFFYKNLQRKAGACFSHLTRM